MKKHFRLLIYMLALCGMTPLSAYADATGTGEFGFYNCYSLNADSFRTSVPTYNPASTDWAQFRTVAELYTGCHLVDIKHAPAAPTQNININMSEGLRYIDYIAKEGWWQIYGEDEHFDISISNISTTKAEGTYTISDLEADWTYLGIINGTDTTYVSFVDGSVTLSVDAQTGNVTVAGTLVGNDGNNYIFNLLFVVPKPQETVIVNIQDAELIYVYAAEEGLYGVSGADRNGIFVQFAIRAEDGFQGEFTEADLDLHQYLGSRIMEGEDLVEIYTANITVTPGNGGDYNITAAVLAYNNKQYNVTMYVPVSTGIEDTFAADNAAKVLRNGQLLIEKNGKTFNALGVEVK